MEYINFTIGDIFKHKDFTAKVPQCFGNNFKAWLWNPSKEKIISIPSSIKKLSEYILPTSTNNTTIQKNNSSTPLDENTFWIILYCLIIEPELGKDLLCYECKQGGTVYLIHVELADGTVVAFDFCWSDAGGWGLCARSFASSTGCCLEGDVFLFFTPGS